MSAHVLGASRIAAVAGVDPYCTPHQLWLEMTGQAVREDNENMLRGRCLESGLVDWWAAITGATDVRKQVVVTLPSDPRIGATLDAVANIDIIGNAGLATEADVLVETKCPRSDGKRVDGAWVKIWGGPDNAHPFHYRLQVVFQLGVAQAAGLAVEYGELAAGPCWGELLRFRVDPQPELFAQLVATAQRFLSYVEAREPLPESWPGVGVAVEATP